MELKNVENTETAQTGKKSGLAAILKENLSLRLVVQVFVVAVMLYAAWRFYGFYQFVQGYGTTVDPYRPPVVEGFLPIAAIVAFKAMFATGTIDTIHPAGLIILLTILITSFIFRRALCSWICPIGTLSEYLGKFGKKVMGRNLTIPKWLDMILLIGKYGLFVFIFKQFILLPSAEAVSFMQIPYYTISDVKMFELFLNIGVKGLAFIGFLMVLSFLFKSFWCRYLCPYGTMVGILGFFSPIILKKDDAACIKCGKCNKVCPNKVDVQAKKSIVTSTECTGCTSCVTACPKPNTLQFKLLGVLPVSRTGFSVAFIVIFFGILVLAMTTGHWDSTAVPGDYQAIYRLMSAMPTGGF